MTAERATTVTLAALRRWREEVLAAYCRFQKEEGWYVKNCLERGVAKSKRCRVCRVLVEIDEAIESGKP